MPGGAEAPARFIIHQIPFLFIVVARLRQVSEVAVVMETPETYETFQKIQISSPIYKD
jgi:hypothetical protein